MRFAKRIVFIVWLAACIQVSGWAEIRPEAGFYTLEATDFHFQQNSYFNRIALRSAPARIWTVFRPADKDPLAKPLFVFFNGGPGSGTCNGLMSAYTAPLAVTMDQTSGRCEIVENPSSWTHIGNLLYIDSRTAGFSYSLMESPDNEARRRAEFDAQNYNCFIDGADFVRVVLRFLAAHPQLQRNRVVIVGESYGGTRATVMLNLLLYYKRYTGGAALFQDPGLVNEIQNHYDAVFPQYRGQTVPPAVSAGQFSHQILIQPAISYYNQRYIATRMLEAPGSILYKLASETGVPFIPWKDLPGSSGTPTLDQLLENIYNYLEKINRDYYLVSKPAGYLNGLFAAAAEFLSQYTSLCQLTDVDVAMVAEMHAGARNNAYKTISDVPTSGLLSGNVEAEQRLLLKRYLLDEQRRAGAREDLASVFGALNPWDRFFIALNYDASTAFVLNHLTFYGLYDELYFGRSQRFGDMFLENAAWVETFITNAAFDLVVFTPAMPEALGLHTSILSASQFDLSRPEGAARPGQILLTYRPGSVPQADVAQRTIRFPRYTSSGHAVTWNEPAEMLADVISWLQSSGGMTVGLKGEIQ